jgi:hypothetical protein
VLQTLALESINLAGARSRDVESKSSIPRAVRLVVYPSVAVRGRMTALEVEPVAAGVDDIPR